MKYTYTYKHTEKARFKVVSYDELPDNDELVLNKYELDPNYKERIRNFHAWELISAEPPLNCSDLEAQEISTSGMSPDEVIQMRWMLQVMGKQGPIGKPTKVVRNVPIPFKRSKKEG